MKNNQSMPEELTELMHSTFFVSEEDDRRHRVWAAISAWEDGYYETIDEALASQQVSIADFENHKDSYYLD